MSSRLFAISPTGRFTEVPPDTGIGLDGDGAVVIQIDNCPPAAGVAQVAELAWFIVPGRDGYRVDYTKLETRRSGGCCGGACGG